MATLQHQSHCKKNGLLNFVVVSQEQVTQNVLEAQLMSLQPK